MPLSLSKISKSNVADNVIDQLLALLLSDKLSLGDSLPPEAELAAALGIGRNSVREAMKVLQVLGIVERRQGDGSYIAEKLELPFASLIFALMSKIGTSTDLVELRRVLEIGTVELVIEKATEEDIQFLREKVERFEELAFRGNPALGQVVEADTGFHLALVEVTKNKALQELCRFIMRLFQPSMASHLSSSRGFRQAAKGHRSTFEAIEARDRQRAREAIIDSFNVWRDYIRVAGKASKASRTGS